MISEGEHNIDNSLKYVQENRKEVLDWLGLDSPKESASLTNEELHIAKALEWIGKQQSNSAEVTNTIKNLDVAAKLLQNFENPTIIEQKNEKNLKEQKTRGQEL